jgi:periplasmic divalent cation tolerance protein
MPEHPVIVVTTWPADQDSAPFALALVEERLAACVNVLGEMQSTYRWAGEVETATERQLVIKTVAEHVPALEARVRALHPYEVPEFLVIPTSGGSDACVAWLKEVTDEQD